MKSSERFTFWICIVISIAVVIFIRPLQDLDEIWNFNIARCIANGLVPYKDISMVSTPLLGFILSIPVKIFGEQLFVERFFSVILSSLVFIGIFKIFRLIRLREEVAIFAIFAIYLIIGKQLTMDYNWLCIFFILVIMWLEIEKNKIIKWDKYGTDFIIGVIGGLVICSKQSIGILVAIAILSIPLISAYNKRGRKLSAMQIGYRALGMLTPVAILILYLAVNGALYDFFDYAIYGMTTFANKKSYLNLLSSDKFIINVLSIVVPTVLITSLITCVYKVIKRKNNITLFILTAYSIVSFLIVFPISDIVHFCVAIVPSTVLIVYILKNFIERYFKGDYRHSIEFTKVATILLALSYTLFMEIYNFEILGKISKYEFQNHFSNIYISPALDDSISQVDSYIRAQDKKVYILDASSAVYMIPIDLYTKDYDMFCIGNLGSGGEQKQIERIKNEDAIYLILSDEYDINWQNPNKVREFIINNLEYVERRSVFDVYVNKTVDEVVNEDTQPGGPEDAPAVEENNQQAPDEALAIEGNNQQAPDEALAIEENNQQAPDGALAIEENNQQAPAEGENTQSEPDEAPTV